MERRYGAVRERISLEQLHWTEESRPGGYNEHHEFYRYRMPI